MSFVVVLVLNIKPADKKRQQTTKNVIASYYFNFDNTFLCGVIQTNYQVITGLRLVC